MACLTHFLIPSYHTRPQVLLEGSQALLLRAEAAQLPPALRQGLQLAAAGGGLVAAAAAASVGRQPGPAVGDAGDRASAAAAPAAGADASGAVGATALEWEAAARLVAEGRAKGGAGPAASARGLCDALLRMAPGAEAGGEGGGGGAGWAQGAGQGRSGLAAAALRLSTSAAIHMVHSAGEDTRTAAHWALQVGGGAGGRAGKEDHEGTAQY